MQPVRCLAIDNWFEEHIMSSTECSIDADERVAASKVAVMMISSGYLRTLFNSNNELVAHAQLAMHLNAVHASLRNAQIVIAINPLL